jgi:hypothetical protein
MNFIIFRELKIKSMVFQSMIKYILNNFFVIPLRSPLSSQQNLRHFLNPEH